MTTTYYEIEEWIPPENSISGKGFWTRLLDEQEAGYWRERKESLAQETAKKLVQDGRVVRLVRIDKTICKIEA